MRCDQFAGLPQSAIEFLYENRTHNNCKHCGQSLPYTDLKECGSYYGMFENEYVLYEYSLKDGRTAQEYVQASPWHSGPVFFLGLKVSSGEKFEWPEQNIDNT